MVWAKSYVLSGVVSGQEQRKGLESSVNPVPWLGWDMCPTGPRMPLQGLSLHKGIHIHLCNLRVSLSSYKLTNTYKPLEQKSPPVICLFVALGNLDLHEY